MGGFHKTLGKIYKPIRMVVDPLNIMDPMQILPGSTSGFTKGRAFTLDPKYGGAARKLFGGGGSTYTPPPKSKINTSGMFNAQNQMLANMRLQSNAEAMRMNAANEKLRASNPTVPVGSIPAQAQAQAQEQFAAQGGSTMPLEQDNISGTSAIQDLSSDIIYKPAINPNQKYVAANTFNLPDMSNIRFGGT